MNTQPACEHSWMNTGEQTQHGAVRRCAKCSEITVLPPGSDEAAKHGCLCPRMDNTYGRGYLMMPGVFVRRDECPIHGVGASRPNDKGQR